MQQSPQSTPKHFHHPPKIPHARLWRCQFHLWPQAITNLLSISIDLPPPPSYINGLTVAVVLKALPVLALHLSLSLVLRSMLSLEHLTPALPVFAHCSFLSVTRAPTCFLGHISLKLFLPYRFLSISIILFAGCWLESPMYCARHWGSKINKANHLPRSSSWRTRCEYK